MRFSKYDNINQDIVYSITQFALHADNAPTSPAIYVISETRIGHVSYGDVLTMVACFDGSVSQEVGDDLKLLAQSLGLRLSIREHRQFNHREYDDHCALYCSFTNTWRRCT